MVDEPKSAGTSSEEDQIALRLTKVAALRELQIEPWGNGFSVTHCCAEVNLAHDGDDAEKLTAAAKSYTVAGRIVALRSMGKLAFIGVRGATRPRDPALTPTGRRATDLQLMLRKDASVGWDLIKYLDLGDQIVATGRAIRTRTGELSLETTEIKLAAKALRPLPEKWHGLSEMETRYRRRYVDLIANPEVRDTFVARAKLVSTLRRFLDERGFLEVETPTLHTAEQAGGAAARPFNTHHNTLDLDLKMRIATELHLKRLVVGGLERVYEVGRIWRNEGIDRSHNPEFTSVEFYWAHATWLDLIALTEELLAALARAVRGSEKIIYQGQDIDLTPPYDKVSMIEYVAAALAPDLRGVSAQLDALSNLLPSAWANFERFASRYGWTGDVREAEKKLAHAATLGDRIAWAFGTFCEPALPKDRPVFVVDFPLETSPLSRKRDSEPRLVDRFELFVAGMEVANAFSELNDPRDQEARFRAQVDARARGDQEAMPFDADFIRALEHGMPPTAGEGLGIDRLAMLLTDSASIRDVILFPLLRPEAK